MIYFQLGGQHNTKQNKICTLAQEDILNILGY